MPVVEPVKANATFTLESYEVTDDGILMEFLCPDPGGGNESLYYIRLTDAELAAVTTQQELRTLVTTKLERKIRAANIASKLDQFIGESITGI